MRQQRFIRWACILTGGFLALTAARVAGAPFDLNHQAISDKIEDEMLMDPGVVSTRIDVVTTDGIVKLEGEVDNLLAKRRAARIAEAVKGVRSVVNRIKVRPPQDRTDAAIERDVETALASDPAADVYEIAVDVQDGVVKLSGTVDSSQERELARKVATGVRGVRGVDDDINVDYATDRPDAEIKREIEEALHWSVYVDDNLISVEVNDGKVELSGTVGSAAEHTTATSTAWVAGVTDVDNSDLSVKGWARDEKLRGSKYAVKSENEIRDAINDALLYDPRVVSLNVDVDVIGGTVTLRGEVDNLRAKRAAREVAMGTVGVSFVRNRLKVRPEGPPSDAEMESGLQTTFRRDPYVERQDITVSVINGVAYLYGTVDSTFDKDRAEDLASWTEGIVDVHNHLSVHDTSAYVYDPFVDNTVSKDELIDYERRAPSMTDAQIKNSIESEIWWSPFVGADDITVTVDDGIATLTGEVESWSERRSATENAYEGGATLVDNDLVVDY